MELIYTILWYLPFVIAALLVLLGVVAVIAACNDFRVGLWIITATFLADCITMGAPILRIGVTWFITDVPLVLIAAAAAVRWLFASTMPRRYAPWLLFALAFLGSLGVGLAINGTSAGVSARPAFYAIAVGSYALSFPMRGEQIHRLMAALAFAAVGLLALSMYRWAVYLLDIRDLLPVGGVYNVDGAIRVVHANAALAIAQVAVIGVLFAGSRLVSPSMRLAAPALIAATLVLQHRSVWLAAIVAVFVGLLLARRARTSWWQSVALVVGAVAVVGATMALSPQLRADVSASASRAVQGQGTVAARFDNWQASLGEWYSKGPAVIAMGRPPGGEQWRVLKAEEGERYLVTHGTHNHYLELLQSHGVLGLTLWLWVVAVCVAGLWRHRQAEDEDRGIPSVLLALILSQAVYFVAYNVDYMQTLILCCALAWVLQRKGVLAAAGIAPAPAHPEPGLAGAGVRG
ncbi:MAG: O-antigen ligase family protein [Rubrivivax sp.]